MLKFFFHDCTINCVSLKQKHYSQHLRRRIFISGDCGLLPEHTAPATQLLSSYSFPSNLLSAFCPVSSGTSLTCHFCDTQAPHPTIDPPSWRWRRDGIVPHGARFLCPPPHKDAHAERGGFSPAVGAERPMCPHHWHQDTSEVGLSAFVCLQE